jgi:hypothetical protein
VFVTGTGHQGFVTIAYDAATGARAWITRSLASGGGNSIAVSPDGSKVFVTGPTLASGSADEYATIGYDTATGKQLWAAAYHGAPGANSTPVALGVSPDSSSVFVTGTTTLSGGHREYATVAYGS